AASVWTTLSCSIKLTCTAYSNPTSNITTAVGPIWAWTKMPRNHDQCRVRRRAKSSRSPKWAACTIATNAWRPEVAIVATQGSNTSGSTGGVERVDSRRLAKIRSAPSPEGPPLLDQTTPARQPRLSCPASSDNVFANDTRALAAVGLFALALSGAAARLMAQTSINDISVKNYGATGNGVTDDTAAFQNAIAAAQSLNQNGVYVPMGKYVIKASLTLNGLEMLGKFAGGWPADSLPMPTLLLRHYTEPGLILQDGASVHGIALDYDSGSPSNSIAPAISLQGQGVTLSSVRIQNPYDAITTPSSATPSRARFSDIFIVQPKKVGIQISKAYDFVQFHHIEVWCNSFLPTGSAFRLGRIDGGTFNG